jgi:hypothetical protein
MEQAETKTKKPSDHLSNQFVEKTNKKIAPMGVQLNSLLTHPQCTKNQCYCGREKCYYSPLWEK